MSFAVTPIAFVHAERLAPTDDNWGGKLATITLIDDLSPEALWGLDAFSHVEILFVFDKVPESAVVTGARHPRGNPAWPRVGIFAQRARSRPNRIGSTLCRIVAVEGRTLTVAELDAIDGTPVIDIKPVIREFLPRGELRQPPWVGELMQDYWAEGG